MLKTARMVVLLLGLLGFCSAIRTAVLVTGGGIATPTDNLLNDFLASQGIDSVNPIAIDDFTDDSLLVATDVLIVISSSVGATGPDSWLAGTAIPILTLSDVAALSLQMGLMSGACTAGTSITSLNTEFAGCSLMPHPIMQISGNVGTPAITTTSVAFTWIGPNGSGDNSLGIGAARCGTNEFNVFVLPQGQLDATGTPASGTRVFLGWPDNLSTDNVTTDGQNLLKSAIQYAVREAKRFSFTYLPGSRVVYQYVPFTIVFNVTDVLNASFTADMQGKTMSLLQYQYDAVVCSPYLGVVATGAISGGSVSFSARINTYGANNYLLEAVCTDPTSPACATSVLAPSETFTIVGPGVCSTNPTLASFTKTGFTVNWSTTAQGASVSSYIFLGPSASGPWTLVHVEPAGTGTATPLSFPVTSLTPGTTYFVLVQNLGASMPAYANNSCTVTSGTTQPDVPDAPATPTFGATTAHSVNVTWVTPNNRGAAITSYSLTIVTGGIWSSVTGITNPYYVHTGLVAATAYKYSVTAINSVGAGAPSLNGTVTTSNDVPDYPLSFSAVTVPPVSRAVNVTWAAAVPRGSPITAYQLSYKTTGAYTVLVSLASTNTALYYLHTGLTASTTYSYQIYAQNAVGLSVIPNNCTVTTAADAANCSATGLPANVALGTCGNVALGGSCALDCNAGFQPSGSVTGVCDLTGAFTTQPSIVCTPNFCSLPTIPNLSRTNGTCSYQGTAVGAKCYLGCAPGFVATTNTSGTCTAPGGPGVVFNPLPNVTCAMAKCAAVAVDPATSGSCDSVAQGAVCGFGCKNGTYATMNVTSGTCVAGAGNYAVFSTAPNITCVPATCNATSALIANGNSAIGSCGAVAQGQTCALGCAIGFKRISGTNSSTCVAAGDKAVFAGAAPTVNCTACVPCSGGCNGHGTCSCDTCICDPAYAGSDCLSCSGANKFGSTCTSDCTCNSAHGTCDAGVLGSGTCKAFPGCAVGWAGSDCNIPCNCSHGTCSGNTTGTGLCASCLANSGWTLASQCLDCQSNYNLTTGCTDCAYGFFGPTCQTCPCANGVCRSGKAGNGTCSACLPGYYGPYCNQSCQCQLPNTCDNGPLGTGLCATCAGNMTGLLCEVDCLCDTTKGVCDSGPRGTGRCDLCTSPVHYGDYCNRSCECSAVHGVCHNKNSDTAGGKCESCIGAWNGENCTIPCDCVDGTCVNTPQGTGQCDFCAVGHQFSSLDVYLCDPCDVGYSKPTDDAAPCQKCDKGKYINETGAANCSLCGPGEFQDVPGSTGCKPCPAGHATDQHGQEGCDACQAGSFAANLGQQTCDDCVIGTFQNVTAGTFCYNCSGGTANNSPAQARCVPCDAGEFSAPRSTLCSKCSAGESSAVASETCAACDVGYYNPTPGGACTQCNKGGTSDPGATACYPAPGFAYDPNDATQFVACQNPDACCGGVSKACGPCGANGTTAGTSIYEGNTCEKCVAGYYTPKQDGKCVQCPQNNLLVVIGAACVVIIACAILVYVAKSATTYLTSVTVALNFFQLTATLAQFQLNWPPVVKQAFEYISLLYLNIDILDLSCVASGGLDFATIWRIKLIMPVLCIGLFLVFWILLCIWLLLCHLVYALNDCCGGCTRTLVRACLGREDEVSADMKRSGRIEADQRNSSLRYACLNACFSLLSLLYVLIIVTCLEIFDCIDDPLGNARYVLRESPVFVCYTPQWYDLRNIALGAMIAYGAGVPIIFMLVLFSVRRHLYAEKVATSVGLLYRKYTNTAYLWELAIILRKLCVIMVTVLPLDLFGQVIVLLSVILIASGAQMYVRPYNAVRTNVLEAVSLVCSLIVLLIGLLIYKLGTPGSPFYEYGGWVVVGAMMVFGLVVICVLAADVLHLRKLKAHGIVGGYATDQVTVDPHFFKSRMKIVSEQNITTQTANDMSISLRYEGDMPSQELSFHAYAYIADQFRKNHKKKKLQFRDTYTEVGKIVETFGGDNPDKLVHVVSPQSDAPDNVQTAIQIDSKEREVHLYFLFRQTGSYRINMVGAVPDFRRALWGPEKTKGKGFGRLIEYNCEVVASAYKQQIVDLTRAGNIIVMSPLTAYLEEGKVVRFELRSRYYDQMVLFEPRMEGDTVDRVTQLKSETHEGHRAFTGDAKVRAGLYVVRAIKGQTAYDLLVYRAAKSELLKQSIEQGLAIMDTSNMQDVHALVPELEDPREVAREVARERRENEERIAALQRQVAEAEEERQREREEMARQLELAHQRASVMVSNVDLGEIELVSVGSSSDSSSEKSYIPQREAPGSRPPSRLGSEEPTNSRRLSGRYDSNAPGLNPGGRQPRSSLAPPGAETGRARSPGPGQRSRQGTVDTVDSSDMDKESVRSSRMNSVVDPPGARSVRSTSQLSVNVPSGKQTGGPQSHRSLTPLPEPGSSSDEAPVAVNVVRSRSITPIPQGFQQGGPPPPSYAPPPAPSEFARSMPSLFVPPEPNQPPPPEGPPPSYHVGDYAPSAVDHDADGPNPYLSQSAPMINAPAGAGGNGNVNDLSSFRVARISHYEVSRTSSEEESEEDRTEGAQMRRAASGGAAPGGGGMAPKAALDSLESLDSDFDI